MKDKIAEKLPEHSLSVHSSENFYIVDYSKKTNKEIGIILHEDDEPEEIKYVHIWNPNRLSICYDGFEDNALKLDDGTQVKQVECILFPDRCNIKDWILLIETKYTNDLEGALVKEQGYPQNMVDKVVSTVDYFREKGIIGPDKRVDAIISFPTLVEGFNSTIISAEDTKKLILSKKIRIVGTSVATIMSETSIKLGQVS